MTTENGFVLEEDQLPMRVTIKGKSGQQIVYCIMPAGRKLGASLQKIDQSMLEKLMS